MVKAVWNGQVIAQSDQTKMVEGNHYFPPEAVNREFLKSSETHTECPWKGTASYYHIEVNGEENKDAAWFYPETRKEADHIRGFVAFWKGVEVR